MPMHLGSHTLTPTCHVYLLNVAAILDDDSSVGSSSHDEMSKSEGGIWSYHMKEADDSNCDCDLILDDSNINDHVPDSSSQVTTPVGNNCESSMANSKNVNNVP